MKVERQGRSTGRGLRTLGWLVWLAIMLSSLWFWGRDTGVFADGESLRQQAYALVPIGLFTLYGLSRLIVLWWPRAALPEPAAEVLVFRRKRRAHLAGMIIGIGVLVMMVHGVQDPAASVFDWIGLAVIGIVLAVTFYGFIRRGAPLILDAEGISGTGARGAAPIAWAAIDKIALERTRTHTAITLALKPESQPKASATVERKAERKQRRPAAMIFPDSYGIDADRMLDAIEEFHRRHVVFR
jgi:hypothetical protein